jgi:hypothetical protein
LTDFFCNARIRSVNLLAIEMPSWINDRLPAQQDGDLHGMVLWGKQAGLLMPWQGVRLHEWWAHSSAWTEPQPAPAGPPMAQLDALMAKMPEPWKGRWCKSQACACLGCANISGGLARKGYTEIDHQKWMKSL